ncbi:hypothetical protein CRG98_001949 [Punica granatum]|uniref:Uncharacterized protein n=1 Tax=Punica granatum TaxID=22663 RepID=A0A2I0LBV0_PUNGR|nr:hypothetical protein CRG98_001949 [Punica granatum]
MVPPTLATVAPIDVAGNLAKGGDGQDGSHHCEAGNYSPNRDFQHLKLNLYKYMLSFLSRLYLSKYTVDRY